MKTGTKTAQGSRHPKAKAPAVDLNRLALALALTEHASRLVRLIKQNRRLAPALKEEVSQYEASLRYSEIALRSMARAANAYTWGFRFAVFRATRQLAAQRTFAPDIHDEPDLGKSLWHKLEALSYYRRLKVFGELARTAAAASSAWMRDAVEHLVESDAREFERLQRSVRTHSDSVAFFPHEFRIIEPSKA